MKYKIHSIAYLFFEFSRRTQWTIIISLLAGITIAHNSMVIPEMSFLMVTTQKLFFIPVILAGFVAGLYGGIGIGCVAAALYPHYLVPHLHIEYMFNIPVISDMVLLLVVGTTTGWLRDRIRDELEKHRRTAQERDHALQQLKASYERARRAEQLAALGHMAAGIAHEIRNPLTSMQGAVDLLRRSLHAHPERGEILLGRLQSEIARLDEITTHVLLFAKPPSTTLTLLNPEPLLAQLTDTLQQQARDHNLSLQLLLETAGARQILGDEDQLRQLVMNLLLNAIDFATAGSVIKLASRFHQCTWELIVENQGPTIPFEVKIHLFEPFFTTRAEGTGLGLAIGARIAEAHNGTLSCESESGVTKFILKIPEA